MTSEMHYGFCLHVINVMKSLQYAKLGLFSANSCQEKPIKAYILVLQSLYKADILISKAYFM